jgi:hypothetical protein
MAALLLAGCGTTDARLTMKLTSEGGITGRGVGGVVIDGTNVTADDTRRSCSGTLSAEEATRLRELASKTDPDAWPESYASPERPHGSPDQIRYTLTVGSRSTSWYGEAGENVPQSIIDLRAALVSVQQRVLRDCSPAPEKPGS